jgi:hypothetical protein
MRIQYFEKFGRVQYTDTTTAILPEAAKKNMFLRTISEVLKGLTNFLCKKSVANVKVSRKCETLSFTPL